MTSYSSLTPGNIGVALHLRSFQTILLLKIL